VPPRPILFCSHVVECGGAEQVWLDYCRAVDPSRIAIHLACPGPGPLATQAQQLGIPVHRVPIGGTRPWRKLASLPGAAWSLRRLAHRLGCDTLVATSMIAGYAAVLAQHRGLRAIWHLHVVTRSRLARWAVRQAAGCITPSRCGAAAVAVAGTRTPTPAVVPNGVDERFFSPQAGDLRRRLSLPSGTVLAGVVGRLDPAKGHRVLFEAMARLGAEAQHLHVVVAGGETFAGSQPEVVGHGAALQQLAARLGLHHRVHWLGPVADTAPLYGDLDLLVLPSTGLESAPRCIAEAMAAGLPVVASDVGGVAEMVVAEQTGWLVAAGDSLALAMALHAAATEPQRRRQFGAAAAAAADRRYRMHTFAERLTAAILAPR
jgi:glycosyltransferase involved in cell wall biosynthesis